MKKFLLLLAFMLIFSGSYAQEVLTEEQRQAKLQEMTDSINANLQKIWNEFNEYCHRVQIKSICGVDFGCTKEEARRVLTNKYGIPKQELGENVFTFQKVKYAGVDFASIHFQFQADASRSYLYAVIFVMDAKNLKEAKSKQKFLASQLESKYVIDWFDENTSSPMFVGGVSPLWTDKCNMQETLTDYLGFRSDIIDYGEKSAKLLDVAYGVRLIYGPYNYVNEEF